jgi:hypothetical protein
MNGRQCLQTLSEKMLPRKFIGRWMHSHRIYPLLTPTRKIDSHETGELLDDLHVECETKVRVHDVWNQIEAGTKS